jgi:hypothetical protein
MYGWQNDTKRSQTSSQTIYYGEYFPHDIQFLLRDGFMDLWALPAIARMKVG